MAKITATPPEALCPTQITVGMIEVRDKQKQLAALKSADQEELLRAHPMPAVVGPRGKLYITDHHHLGRAAVEAGVGRVFCEIEVDFSAHDPPGFWKEMEESSWVHPLDENGVRHIYSRLPARLAQMVDDVYRSLAAYVRNAGGYDKTGKVYAEFFCEGRSSRRGAAQHRTILGYRGCLTLGISGGACAVRCMPLL